MPVPPDPPSSVSRGDYASSDPRQSRDRISFPLSEDGGLGGWHIPPALLLHAANALISRNARFAAGTAAKIGNTCGTPSNAAVTTSVPPSFSFFASRVESSRKISEFE